MSQEQELKITFNKLKKFRHFLATCNPEADWFCQWQIEELEERCSKLRRKIDFQRSGFDTDNLDQLKEDLKIGDIMPSEPVMQAQTRDRYLCPLHNEKTASFTVYKNNNSWYCFGCGAGGSVIDLYMALNNLDFSTAVKSLKKGHLNTL